MSRAGGALERRWRGARAINTSDVHAMDMQWNNF